MKFFLLSLALASCLTATAKPLDAAGSCPTKNPIGTISRIVPSPKTGMALVGKQAEAAFAAAHEAGTAGEYPWLHDLTGKTGASRRYREGAKEVIVLAVCDPADCDRLRAYVAFEPASSTWGATVFEGGQIREIVQGAGSTTLAMHKPVLAKALLCAINTDDGIK